MRLWRLILLALFLGVAGLLVGSPTTTAASGTTFTYDASAHARLDADASAFSGVGQSRLSDLPQGSAAPSVEAWGTSTTPVGVDIATEAGYTASKINITEDGLNHVFDRHLADGSLSAGKSLFNDNVTITRLIADAEAVVPGVQGNGNLAYVVDAGRAIGVDRVTGQATSIYTVITKPGGDLVTAFPGTP